MSDRDQSPNESAYGHPEADWTDDDGDREDAKHTAATGDGREAGEDDDQDGADEDEPPDARADPGNHDEPPDARADSADQDEPPDVRANADDEEEASGGEAEGADPESDGPDEAGDPLSPTWAQPQGRYPAPERPTDRADALPRQAGGGVEPVTDPGERPHAPDATTGDEGGGTDAEFRDEDDREAGRPPRKSPARERRRAG